MIKVKKNVDYSQAKDLGPSLHVGGTLVFLEIRKSSRWPALSICAGNKEIYGIDILGYGVRYSQKDGWETRGKLAKIVRSKR